jgi:hypothetical protein
MAELNLIEALQEEIKRVNEIIAEYEKFPSGIFAATMMKQSVKNAESAIAQMDTIEMIYALKDLQEYEL